MIIGQRFNPTQTFTGCFIPNCMLRYKEISPIDKLVWGRLNQYAGSNGVCHPKQETLAEEIGVSVRSIINALHTLEEEGFIETERVFDVDKLRNQNNKYFFKWHSVFEQNNHVQDIQVANDATHVQDIHNKKGFKSFKDLKPIVPQNILPVKSRRTRTILSTSNINPDCLKIAQALARVVQKNYPKDVVDEKRIIAWVEPISDIFKKWDGTPNDLLEMLRVYYANFDRKNIHHVIIKSGNTLKEKREKLETFVDRINSNQQPSTRNTPARQSQQEEPKYKGPRVGCDPNGRN